MQTKGKVRSIKWFTIAAEILILLDWITALLTVVSISGVTFDSFLDLWGNILESATLTFEVLFRFFYLSISKGFWRVIRRRKLELLMTHGCPWYILNVEPKLLLLGSIGADGYAIQRETCFHNQSPGSTVSHGKRASDRIQSAKLRLLPGT